MEDLNVIDARRQLFDAQSPQAQLQGKQFLTLVNLYRALGGGWVLEAGELADNLRQSKNE